MATYPSRTPGPLGVLEDRLAILERALRTVTPPTAEQYAQAVGNLTNYWAVGEDAANPASDWGDFERKPAVELRVDRHPTRWTSALFFGSARITGLPKGATVFVQQGQRQGGDQITGLGADLQYTSTGEPLNVVAAGYPLLLQPGTGRTGGSLLLTFAKQPPETATVEATATGFFYLRK